MTLNPEQQQAVGYVEGPLLVSSGAGSGKTKTVTHRAAHLLDLGVDPRRILLVTFTKKAAGEMRARLSKLVGMRARGMWIGTFHATCAQLLRGFESDALRAGRKRQFTIYDGVDSKGCVKLAIKALRYDESVWKAGEVRERISKLKGQGKQPSDLIDDVDPQQDLAGRLWAHYEEQLLRANAFDFDDLLAVVYRALGQSGEGSALRQRFEHVMVDEFQDTSPIQFRLVRRLAASGNLCVVGDYRQAVYSFRGAEPKNLLHFTTQLGARTVDLVQNYRSTGRIVRCFNALAEVGAPMRTDNPEGHRVRVRSSGGSEQEASAVVRSIRERLLGGTPPSECAVLYRVHALSRAVEDALRDSGIAYQIVGGLKFYQRSEVKDALAYLRLALNPDSDADLLRAINQPPRAVGDGTVAKLSDRATRARQSCWAALAGFLRETKLTPKTRAGLQQFQRIVAQAQQNLTQWPLAQSAELLVELTGLREHWHKLAARAKAKQKGAEAERALQKALNIDQVVSAVRAYAERTREPTLQGYLDEVAALSDQDELRSDKVSLMTVHAAKGLEFDAVWVVGFERGLLPLAHAASPDERAEEQRIAYVACSRARKWLTLSYCEERWLQGSQRPAGPSPLLDLLPEADVDWPTRPPRPAPALEARP